MRDFKITYTGPRPDTESVVGVLMLAVLVSIPAAWFTHFVWIIRKLAGDVGVTIGQVALGALGAFFPPIGILHGYMIWFGVGF